LRRLIAISAFIFAAMPAKADVWWLEGVRARPTVPANIIGPVDNREWLTPEHGQKLGLSAAEVIRIQDSTGFVNCRGGIGSAALVFDNQHIVTALHVIVDRTDSKKKFRENCAFYAHDPLKRYVAHPLILAGDSYISGTIDVEKNPGSDWVIVKLSRPVARGMPFAIGDERIWRMGNPIIAISSVQRDKPGPMHKENPGLPLAHKCTIRQLWKNIGSRGFRSDCDMEPGGSGGVSVARIDGNLVLAGIFIRAGKSPNFLPYAPTNSTIAISVADEMVNAIFRLGAAEIKSSAHQKHALLAGDIGDELDETSRLIALRTEMQALNNFMASGALRWRSQKASGYVLPLPHNGQPPAIDRCRSFVHAVVYGPDRVKSAKGKVCREKSGKWAVAKADLQSEVRPASQAAGAPPCSSARSEQRETPSSQCR
jgi:surface antigen